MRSKIILITSLFFFCLLLPGNGLAFKEKIRAGVPPFTILEIIMTTNQGVREPNANQRAPLVTWLASSDPRIRADHIMTTPPAGLYPVRNLGGIFQQDIGSVDFGVNILRTPILLITANTDSRAMALIAGQESSPTTTLANHLQPLRQFLDKLPQDTNNNPNEPVEKWLDFQVNQALKHYMDRVENRRLVVLGGIIDLANTYDRGIGSLIIINANGETDSDKLKHLPIMRRLNEETLDFVGRSGMAIFQTDSKFPPGAEEEDQPGTTWEEGLQDSTPQQDIMPEYLKKY